MDIKEKASEVGGKVQEIAENARIAAQGVGEKVQPLDKQLL